MKNLITVFIGIILTVCVVMCGLSQPEAVEESAYQHCTVVGDDIMVEIKDHYVMMIMFGCLINNSLKNGVYKAPSFLTIFRHAKKTCPFMKREAIYVLSFFFARIVIFGKEVRRYTGE